MGDKIELEEIDLDVELSKVAEATRIAMDAGTLSASEGLQINTLCAIGAQLLEIGNKLDNVYDVVCEISDQLNEKKIETKKEAEPLVTKIEVHAQDDTESGILYCATVMRWDGAVWSNAGIVIIDSSPEEVLTRAIARAVEKGLWNDRAAGR